MTFKIAKKSLAVLLPAVGLVIALAARQEGDLRPEKLLEEKDFSGAMLVAKNGRVVFKSARGFADLEGRIPLTTRSSFNLASVSKQFTAAAVMLLSEEKKLDLDDPVARFLPELAYARGITIRQLLNHTAGLPDYYEILDRTWDKTKIAGNEDVLRIFAERKPAVIFRPGERMAYSNTGYIILASVVERIAGVHFSRFLEDRIFRPLGMKDSFVYDRTMPAYPRAERVFGFRIENGARVLDDLIYCDGTRGDGNVHSSAEDLFIWDRALYGEALLKKETIRLMFSPGRLNDGSSTDYGFGFGLSDGGKVVSHGGGWVGFRTQITRYIDRGDTLIVLINCLAPKSRGVMNEIIKLFSLDRN